MKLLKQLTSGNRTVDRMLQLDFSFSGASSYIPNTWYKTIHFGNGKPYTIACIILSEIVYWYKPQVISDERSGQILDKNLDVIADLPNLCDVLPDGTLVFDDSFGTLRRSRIYSIEELIAMAKEQMEVSK